MKNRLLFVVVLIVHTNSLAQIRFEEGYFITNTDKKITCFIRNTDWKNNPTKFNYKLTIDGEKQTNGIETVKEFGIKGYSKYVRSTVRIDRSSENINKISAKREPVFREETLFLKVLVSGEATLYEYEDNEVLRYFFNVGNTPISQLVFKSYQKTNTLVGKNIQFKNQLWNGLKCLDITQEDFEKLSYNKKDLAAIFVAYNQCSSKNNHSLLSNENTDYTKSQARSFFKLGLKGGMNSSQLTIERVVRDIFSGQSRGFNNIDFENKITARLGLEIEFVMPFNKNKWALIFEPTYNFNYESQSQNQNALYASFELPLGARHYFFLNDKSKIFINGYLIADYPTSSSGSSSFGEFTSSFSQAFGLGYRLKDTYSLEVRYQTSKELFGNSSNIGTDYTTLSVVLGYLLF